MSCKKYSYLDFDKYIKNSNFKFKKNRNLIDKNDFDYIYQNFGLKGLEAQQKRIELGEYIEKEEIKYQEGNIKIETWKSVYIFSDYNICKLHRLRAPSYIEYFPNGNKKIEKYYFNDKLTNGEEAAVIKWFQNGKKKCEEIHDFERGLHHLQKPAIIEYYQNGNKKLEKWYKHNQLFRKGEPAYIEWYDNGEKKEERYYKNNHLYRGKNKECIIKWDEEGKIILN